VPDHSAVAARSMAEIERRIRTAVYTPIAPLAATAWVTPEPVSFAQRRAGRRLRLQPGDRWSDTPFDCAWFLFTGAVPVNSAERDVVLLIDVNGEACVVDDHGRPTLGLTNVSSGFSRQFGEPGKRVVPFRTPAAGGEAVELWAEAGANDLFGNRQDNGTLKEAVIAIRNRQLHALQYDFEVLHALMRYLPKDRPTCRMLARCLVSSGRGAAGFHGA
jgi:alpha-mannosidase